MQAVDTILAQVYGVQYTSQANAARKRKEPCRPGTARSTADQTAEAAVLAATVRIMITAMITRAARSARGRRRSTSSDAQIRSCSVTREAAVIPANIVTSTPTGSATLS